MSIPALGTTHADYFYGDIPCTRDLTAEEINLDYERNTGLVIIETIGDKDPMEVPGIVVKTTDHLRGEQARQMPFTMRLFWTK